MLRTACDPSVCGASFEAIAAVIGPARVFAMRMRVRLGPGESLLIVGPIYNVDCHGRWMPRCWDVPNSRIVLWPFHACGLSRRRCWWRTCQALHALIAPLSLSRTPDTGAYRRPAHRRRCIAPWASPGNGLSRRQSVTKAWEGRLQPSRAASTAQRAEVCRCRKRDTGRQHSRRAACVQARHSTPCSLSAVPAAGRSRRHSFGVGLG